MQPITNELLQCLFECIYISEIGIVGALQPWCWGFKLNLPTCASVSPFGAQVKNETDNLKPNIGDWGMKGYEASLLLLQAAAPAPIMSHHGTLILVLKALGEAVAHSAVAPM